MCGQLAFVEPADILVGQQIVQVLSPFLPHLLDKRLAKATVSRHRDSHLSKAESFLARIGCSRPIRLT